MRRNSLENQNDKQMRRSSLGARGLLTLKEGDNADTDTVQQMRRNSHENHLYQTYQNQERIVSYPTRLLLASNNNEGRAAALYPKAMRRSSLGARGLVSPDDVNNTSYEKAYRNQERKVSYPTDDSTMEDELSSAGDEEDCIELHVGHHLDPEMGGGHPALYDDPDDNKENQLKDEYSNPEEETSHTISFDSSSVEIVKFLFSLALLLFSVMVVMAAIFSKQTVVTGDKNNNGIHPMLAGSIFWFLVGWLAMMEGGQGALVGLQPVDKASYADTHPRALMSTMLSHEGDNMERFIIGRQFLVVLVVFVVNLMASGTNHANVLGLGGTVTAVCLNWAVILITIMLGQLTAQVNAANCMLDFINNYFMLFTTYVSLAIEASGILHSVYLVQLLFSKLTGQPIESNEPPRDQRQNVFFWGRVFFSVLILAISFAVTQSALLMGMSSTNADSAVPEWVSVLPLIILMSAAGIMEGMQIALFALVNLGDEELKAQNPIAYQNCQLAFMGQNLQAFLIGRQICVTFCMVIVARITSVRVDIHNGDSENMFGVSDDIQDFFNTNLLSAVITTIFASLMWRIIAASCPIAFLSNPLIYWIICWCLLLEQSGICSASWVLARYYKSLVNHQPDKVYLEGADRHTAEPATRRDQDIDSLVHLMKNTLHALFWPLVWIRSWLGCCSRRRGLPTPEVGESTKLLPSPFSVVSPSDRHGPTHQF